jgi:hypothetical protein
MDTKPEVQNLAKLGMTSYLLVKPMTELTSLAASYAKNCAALAERERQRRRKAHQSDSSSIDKIDKMHTVTVMMTSCMILSFPYDVPDFIPGLLTNLARYIF